MQVIFLSFSKHAEQYTGDVSNVYILCESSFLFFKCVIYNMHKYGRERHTSMA